jgi:hypothetical protein
MEKQVSISYNEREALLIADATLLVGAVITRDEKLITESIKLIARGLVNNCYNWNEVESLTAKMLEMADVFSSESK